jgi:hypothetical protein
MGLSEGIYAQLRVERIASLEMASIIDRCRTFDLAVSDQAVGGQIVKLWARQGDSVMVIDCDPQSTRPVTEALECLLDRV